MPDQTPDRLLSRVDTLVTCIRKIDKFLLATPDDPRRERMLERRVEYQMSLHNIQEFGRETIPRPVGVKIEVPADVMKTMSVKE